VTRGLGGRSLNLRPGTQTEWDLPLAASAITVNPGLLSLPLIGAGLAVAAGAVAAESRMAVTSAGMAARRKVTFPDHPVLGDGPSPLPLRSVAPQIAFQCLLSGKIS
jgi:hypothetical protein